MALNKRISYPDGRTVAYWRYVFDAVDLLAGAARLVFAGYLTAKDRKAGRQPSDTFELMVSGDDLPRFLALAVSRGAETMLDARARAAYVWLEECASKAEKGVPVAAFKGATSI